MNRTFYPHAPAVTGRRLPGRTRVAVKCPGCGQRHTHGYTADMTIGEGSHRSSHCSDLKAGDGYFIKVSAGTR